jgi:SAM-dependent methyltransferase
MTANERTLDDDWIGVFRQRGVWDLTPDTVSRWVARNPTFFAWLDELVPPGGSILELGCGPGRHALGAARTGRRVRGIDVDPAVVAQAAANAARVTPDADVRFAVADMLRLDQVPGPGGELPPRFDAITHGGLMEHFPSAEAIAANLADQLQVAPLLVFDVPIGSDKNLRLFERDDIFRQLWTAEEWMAGPLAGFEVLRSHTESHPDPNMTDDLVVALGRSGA